MAGDQASIRNFYAPANGPGRTAPALIEDLFLYDRNHPPQPGRHILQDPPTHFVQTPELEPLLPPGSCKHDFRIQQRQSFFPALDELPDQDSCYQVASICLHCRVHLLLKVDFTVAWKDEPCPNHSNPLHHLALSSWRQETAYMDLQREDPETQDEIYVYECSSTSCSAIVTVRLSPPILHDQAVHLLTDPDLLHQRTEAAFAAKRGHVEGMKRPSPLDVLMDLRAYIKNSWEADAQTEINYSNKRFAVRFGPEGTACKPVLELLHFTLKPGTSWVVPRPDPTEQHPMQQPINVFLDNAEAELDALILNRPDEELLVAEDPTHLEPAFIQFSRVLGCQNYDKARTVRNIAKDPALRKRPFTVLGIPENASDELIIFAYQKQVATGRDDLRQTALLMTALEEIRRIRNSEELGAQVAIERSMGRYGMETLQDAYKSLGLQLNDQYDDKHIIGVFQSRMHDVPAEYEQDMRQNLYIIGEYRGSREIKNFAQKSVETYEDALQFLGADFNTGDDFIRSLYTMKTADDVSNTEMARKSVRFIADERNSEQLKAFVAADFENIVPEATMDIGEAYQILGIDDRTERDADTLFGTYSVRIEDDPGNSDRLKKAIDLIAKEINNPTLNSYLGITDAALTIPTISRNEPLGLENIGNTCYLNSLLQWLFTILPLRNIVLDFDDYRMDPSEENIAKKKVGHRYVSRREVDASQKFARRLGELFLQMITSSRTSIRPEIELARLTLETNFIKGGRRSSTLQSGRRPTLGTIDSQPILGPLPEGSSIDSAAVEGPLLSPLAMDDPPVLQPPSQELNVLNNDHIASDVSFTRDADDSSEATLVSKPSSDDYEHVEIVSKEQQQAILDNKENLSPVKEENVQVNSTTALEKPEPLAPASPSRLNAQAGALEVKKEETTKSESTSQDVPMIYAPPPGPPPSLPPRRPVAPSTTALEEYARQQDVQEVMGHAVFQLSCAMRPKGFDKNGEQLDEINDMFYGESRIYTVKDKTLPEAAQQFLSIQAGIFNEPKDLYAALDNEFDVAQREDGTGAYQSITKLPPVLTISLGRVIFDEKTRAQIKVNHHVDLPTTIYMDRYMDAPEGSVLTDRRRQAWQYKNALRKLQDRKHQLEKSAPTSLAELYGHLKSSLEHLQAAASSDPSLADLTIPQSCIEDAEILEKNLRHEQEAVNTRIEVLQKQIDDSFTDSTFRKLEYRLHAAFFHRGTVGSGHYWVYIFDHQNEIWRKYNDDRVTQVQDLREIFADPSNDTSNPNRGFPNANPYFLVYVQTEHIPEGLVETVKREPVVPEEEEQKSVVNNQDMPIYPLGSDEFAGQPSQMSELPPGSMQNGHHMVDMALPESSNDHQRTTDEDVQMAVARSLQEPTLKKVGDWDDSEAMVHPSKFQG